MIAVAEFPQDARDEITSVGKIMTTTRRYSAGGLDLFRRRCTVKRE